MTSTDSHRDMNATFLLSVLCLSPRCNPKPGTCSKTVSNRESHPREGDEVRDSDEESEDSNLRRVRIPKVEFINQNPLWNSENSFTTGKKKSKIVTCVVLLRRHTPPRTCVRLNPLSNRALLFRLLLPILSMHATTLMVCG